MRYVFWSVGSGRAQTLDFFRAVSLLIHFCNLLSFFGITLAKHKAKDTIQRQAGLDILMLL